MDAGHYAPVRFYEDTRGYLGGETHEASPYTIAGNTGLQTTNVEKPRPPATRFGPLR